jgi:hypothetical protein
MENEHQRLEKKKSDHELYSDADSETSSDGLESMKGRSDSYLQKFIVGASRSKLIQVVDQQSSKEETCCSVCSKQFAVPWQLNQHLKRSHNS